MVVTVDQCGGIVEMSRTATKQSNETSARPTLSQTNQPSIRLNAAPLCTKDLVALGPFLELDMVYTG